MVLGAGAARLQVHSRGVRPTMATFRVKLRDLEKTPVSLPTDEPHLIVVTRCPACRLEVADVHFNFDSAVFLPDAGAAQTDDPSITGLAVLRACLQYAQAHPEQPAAISGHTDTVGTPGYNLTLSSLRAQNVKAALVGKRDDWASSAAAKYCVADVQRILRLAAYTLSWDCDPGRVDNKPGPQTAQAVKNFQARYNDVYGASIGVDGKVGSETWGAFFDVYMLELRDLLGTDDSGLAALQQGITFVDPNHAAVGCGENHPIEAAGQDQYRSATNRRVEILFFNPGDEPTFPCHPSDDTCRPAACPIYRLGHYQFDPLPVDVTPFLRVRFQINGDALANEPYQLFLDDATDPTEGSTDGDGQIERPLPFETRSVTIVLPKRNVSRVLNLVALDPIETLGGAQARLKQLGYYQGNVDGQPSDLSTAAIEGFQEDQGLTQTGDLDAPTVDALRSAYGS
jgi:outer membrane protein OmpA-like peptidoglycan-associated protein